MPNPVLPTAHADVNSMLDQLLAEVHIVLGEQLVALYLYGSLSSGDFNPHSSDIDFVFVTAGVLPDATVAALDAMHHQLWASGDKWAAKLEGAYVPRDLIRRHDPAAAPCPTVNEGEFYLERLGSDWIIQRHVVREEGVVLFGPPTAELIEPVSPDDIRESVRGVMREWWEGHITDDTNLRRFGYSPFAVLTMCRVLYALEHGTIASKPTAARWALTVVDARWHPLITQALSAWQSGGDMDAVAEIQALIAYVVDRAADSDGNQM
jgi:hypothetical protein